MKKILLLLLISFVSFGQRNISRLLEQKDSLAGGLIYPAQRTAVDLNLLGVGGKNLFNPADAVLGQFISNSNGTINSAIGWARSGRVPVEDSTVYTLSGVYAIASASFAIRYENSANTLLGYRSASNGGITYPLTFTTPANCAYVVFTIKHANYDCTLQEAAERILLEKSSSATSFSEYIAPLPSALSARQKTADIVTTGGKNLFNIATASLDGFFMENTGTVFAFSGYGYSDFIKVKPGLTYTGWDGINGMRKTTYFDAAKAVISGLGSTDNITTFTVPQGVAYVRVTYYSTRKGTFQFEQSDVATTFEAFGAKTIVSINGAAIAASGAASATKTITLANMERITFFGDSYSEGYNALPGKAYTGVISQFTDWNIENYSKSGDNYDEILTRIKANATTFKSTGIKTFTGGGYAFLISFTNDNNDGIINSTDQLNAYIAKLREVITAVKGLGYRPVICTEYHNISGANGALLMQSVLSELATREGCIFADMYEKTRFLRGTDYSYYWDGSHPNLRANALFTANLLPYVHALPRPKTGIKIFRVRDSTVVSTTADLMVNDISERARKYAEITVTQRALADSLFRYYDNMPYITGKTSQVTAEYLDLMNNGTLSMGNYTLIDYIVNATSANTQTLKLFVGNTTATVYVRDVINRTWVELLNTGGYVTLSDPKSQMDFDKVSILLYNSGGITLSAPFAEFTGTEGKDYYVKPLPRDFRTAELLSTPLITTTTGWTTTGTVTPADASDNNYPTGVTKVVTLNASNAVAQTVTFTAADHKRRAQVKIIARRNPARYTGSTFPSGAPINLRTFDQANVKLQIIKSTSTATFERTVFLHWTETVFEFDVAAGDTTFDIKLLRGSYAKDIEFCKASVKIE